MAVLLVDDDRDLIDVLTYILRREGYEVIAAYDGEQGWARFQDDQPELVVLDANMPGLDGMEVCRRMREVSTTPVIMLTARTDEADIVQALGLGADDYITKPFSPRQLVARVKAVLRRAQAFAASGSGGGEELRAGELTLDLRTPPPQAQRGRGPPHPPGVQDPALPDAQQGAGADQQRHRGARLGLLRDGQRGPGQGARAPPAPEAGEGPPQPRLRQDRARRRVRPQPVRRPLSNP